MNCTFLQLQRDQFEFLGLFLLAFYGGEMFFGFFKEKEEKGTPLPLCYKSIKKCLYQSPFSIDFEKFNLRFYHIFPNFRI